MGGLWVSAAMLRGAEEEVTGCLLRGRGSRAHCDHHSIPGRPFEIAMMVPGRPAACNNPDAPNKDNEIVCDLPCIA